MPFKKGTTAFKQRRNENGGRKPDWLKDRCRHFVSQNNLIEFLADVASGETVQKLKKLDGKTIESKISADMKDRLKAVEMLIDRGWGKPSQAMEHTGKDGEELIIQVVNYANPKHPL